MLSFIGDALGKAIGLVDDLITTDEERLALKAPLMRIQAEILSETLKYETKSLEARATIIETEAKSSNWLTASWRPITMLVFLALIVAGQLGGPPVPEEMWPLLKLGLGGYVIGRSAEKVVAVGAKALKAAEKAG